MIAQKVAQLQSAVAQSVSIAISTSSSAAGRAVAGGDWCEAVALSEHAVALTVGDVSGHGRAVAGAMALMRSSILRTLRDLRVPSSVLGVANEVAWSLGDGLLVTAVVAVLDHRLQTLTFANAGHPPPLLLTADRHAFLENRPADLPLGVFSAYSAADYVVALPLDALVVLYTDGITEHDRDPLRGEVELVEAARYAFDRPHLYAARAIARRVLRRKRGEDDAAAIALRCTPLPS